MFLLVFLGWKLHSLPCWTLASHTRWDFRLPTSAPIVRQALAELLGKGASLGDALEALAGSDAELWELSALISSPGAAPQVVHRDIDLEDLGTRAKADGYRPVLLTAFVALQPVTRDMGPTRFLPGTHDLASEAGATNLPEHATALLKELAATGTSGNFGGEEEDEDGDGGDGSLPLDSHVGLLDTGEVALYDSRLLHCGGANRSEKERVLFYVTFRAEDGSSPLYDPSRSILPCDATRFRLSDFR